MTISGPPFDYTALKARIKGFNEESWAYMYHIEAPRMMASCNALENPEERFETLTILSNGDWIAVRDLVKAPSFLSAGTTSSSAVRVYKAVQHVLESRCSPALTAAFEEEYRRGFSDAWQGYPESKLDFASIFSSSPSTVSDLGTKTGYTTGMDAGRSARSNREHETRFGMSDLSEDAIPVATAEDIARGHHHTTRQLFRDILQRNTTRKRGPGFYGPTDIDTIRSVLKDSISLMRSDELEQWVKIEDVQKETLEEWEGMSEEDKTTILFEVGRYLHYRDKRNQDKERKRLDKERETARAARAATMSEPTV